MDCFVVLKIIINAVFFILTLVAFFKAAVAGLIGLRDSSRVLLATKRKRTIKLFHWSVTALTA